MLSDVEDSVKLTFWRRQFADAVGIGHYTKTKMIYVEYLYRTRYPLA